MGHARVMVQYTFHATDGTSVTATVSAESMDSGDKATAKAMSVAYRTALLQTLCLPTDDQDPDADTFVRSPLPAELPRVAVGSAVKKAPVKQVASGKPQASGNHPISDSQASFITKLAAKIELAEEDIAEIAGKVPSAMNSAEASAFIADLLAVTKDTASIEFGEDSRPRIVHK
jgi:flagellum-specific peptidoglycan hydrolase FlgJ